MAVATALAPKTGGASSNCTLLATRAASALVASVAREAARDVGRGDSRVDGRSDVCDAFFDPDLLGLAPGVSPTRPAPTRQRAVPASPMPQWMPRLTRRGAI